MNQTGTAIHNLIEPPGLVAHFLAHPPINFRVWRLGQSVPAFSTRFDLLTTMKPVDRRRIEAWPLHRWWRRYLQPRTAFVGTTCTEYALLPEQGLDTFLDDLLQLAKPAHSFIIIKDIPCDATLLPAASVSVNQNLIAACVQRGFLLMEGQALAYVPINFDSTDTYLARLSAARRKNIRRKLKSASQLDIQTHATGDPLFDDGALLAEYYALYCNVYEQSDIHFDLLSQDFFCALLQDAQCGGVVFSYHAQGKLIGYNLCLEHQGRLLDKYMGLAYPQAHDYNLYVVSWFHNLDYARKRGLTHYVAGWTDPEIKRDLGARFTFTQHAVYIRNPLLRMILKPFKRFFEGDTQWRPQTF